MSETVRLLGRGILAVVFCALCHSAFSCPQPPNADAKVCDDLNGSWGKELFVYLDETVCFSALQGSYPDYDFSYDPDNVPEGDPSYQPYPGLGITNYKWEYRKDDDDWITFADGSGEAGPSRVFPEPGTYLVKLTVTDDEGQTPQRQLHGLCGPGRHRYPRKLSRPCP